jgi:uncharacterized protein YpuA (DUF1002 family)
MLSVAVALVLVMVIDVASSNDDTRIVTAMFTVGLSISKDMRTYIYNEIDVD